MMCGRFIIANDENIAEIEKILRGINENFSESGAYVKTGEIYPTDNVPILCIQNARPAISIMTWGFPKWDGKGVIINAKSETAAEKNMFKESLLKRRCVVPSTGFYEWAKNSNKTKYRFNDPSCPMLYMAGIYTDYPGLGLRFVTLTRAANNYISDIHDRMPVILYKDELVRWLTDYNFAVQVMNRDSVTLEKTM